MQDSQLVFSLIPSSLSLINSTRQSERSFHRRRRRLNGQHAVCVLRGLPVIFLLKLKLKASLSIFKCMACELGSVSPWKVLTAWRCLHGLSRQQRLREHEGHPSEEVGAGALRLPAFNLLVSPFYFRGFLPYRAAASGRGAWRIRFTVAMGRQQILGGLGHPSFLISSQASV